jgi:hypothetical protein
MQLNFCKNVGETEIASLRHTLYALHLHALRKLVGEIYTRKVDNCDKYQGGTYYIKKLYIIDP